MLFRSINLEDYEDTDEVTGIKYRGMDYYYRKMMEDPNSVSQEIKLILADNIAVWIHRIIDQLITLHSWIISYIGTKDDTTNFKFKDDEKIMIKQKILEYHGLLESEYDDWKRKDYYWKYLTMFTDEEHSSFEYYFNHIFKHSGYTVNDIFEK